MVAGCGDGTTAPPRGLEVRPGIADFGWVPVGGSAQKLIALHNTSGETVRILDARPSDGLRGEVRLDALPASLAPSGAVELRVTLSPSGRGTREGELTFVTQPPEAGVALRLVAVAVAPSLEVTPQNLDFGRVRLGETATLSVSLRNAGAQRVMLESLVPDPLTTPEFIAVLRGSRVVWPGETALLPIAYQPRDLGVDRGRVTLGEVGEQVRTVLTLVGEGVLGDLSLDPEAIHFSGQLVGEPRTRWLELRNAGEVAHRISRLELAHEAASAAFRVEPPVPAPFELAPGEVARVAVTFTPSGPQSLEAAVVVESTGLRVPATVRLTGRAAELPGGRLDAWPRRLEFGGVQLGSAGQRPLELTNVGPATLHVRGVAVEPPQAPYRLVDAPAPGALLGPLEAHVFTVLAEPRALGAVAPALLVIESDDPDRPRLEVPLSAQGRADPVPDLLLSTSRLDFGRVPRGLEVIRALTVTSVGTAPVAVGTVSLVGDANGRYLLRGGGPRLPVLQPGESARLGVVYADPTGLPGSHRGLLRLLSSDPDWPVIDVTLDAWTVDPTALPPQLRVELAWAAAGADLDLHLVRPAGVIFDRPGDCCHCNPNPPWGGDGRPEGDPLLERSSLEGPGQEAIRLERGALGPHRVFVHAWRVPPGEVARAEVRIFSGGALEAVHTRALAHDQLWEVATVTLDPAGAGQVEPSRPPLGAAPPRSCW